MGAIGSEKLTEVDRAIQISLSLMNLWSIYLDCLSVNPSAVSESYSYFIMTIEGKTLASLASRSTKSPIPSIPIDCRIINKL